MTEESMKNTNTVHLHDTKAPQPTSPARAKLAALLDRRDQAQRRVTELQAARDRLGDVGVAREKAAADLADFDRRSTAAMVEWARSHLKPPGTEPTVDDAERQKLLVALSQAQATAASAHAAKTELERAIQIEAQAARSVDLDVEHAVAEIIADLARGPLLDDLQEAQRAVALKKSRLDQALRTIIDIAHKGPHEVMRGTFVLMEGLADTFRTAAEPVVETGFADRQKWEAFAARLRGDAAAELGD
jgi:hypothetical protein